MVRFVIVSGTDCLNFWRLSRNAVPSVPTFMQPCAAVGGLEETMEEAEEDVIKREIDSYWAEPEVSREEKDILKWWRGRRTLYPNLARLAR